MKFIAAASLARRNTLYVAIAVCAAFLAPRSAGAQQQGPTPLEEIAVEGRQSSDSSTSNPNSPLTQNGYVATSSAVGTKTKTPLVEIPQSISTVTRQQLEDRNNQSLTTALNYTAGVRTNTSGFDPRFDTFFVRGFDATYTGIFRDGLREQNSPFAIFKTEPYGLDGVSILKGPASALYGGGSPGGIVDLTTKRPTFQPFGEVETQIGNNGRYQEQFDVGGPVGEQGAMAYRLTGLARKSDTDVPGTPDDKVYIAPAFTWQPDDDTKFTLLSEYSHIKTGANLAYYNDTSGSRPRVTKTFSGDPSFNKLNQDQGRIGYEFEHKFAPNVTFTQNLRFSHVDVDAEYIDIIEFAPGATQADRGAGKIKDSVDALALDNRVEVKGETGALSHMLVGGVDVQYADFTDRTGYADSIDNPELVSPIDLDPLTYGGHIDPPDANSGNLRQKQRQVGVYAQDQIKIGQFVATLGLRNDWVRTKSDDRLAGESSVQNDQKVTGRAGLTYLGPYGLNPYVSYSTSFSPLLGSTFGSPVTDLLKPTSGDQIEAGLKFAPPDHNAVVTAAVFDIDQKSVVRSNGLTTTQTGEIRAKGFEIEATGTLDNGLSFTAAYTYLNQEIVKGDIELDPVTGEVVSDTTGNRPSAIPKHAASLWVNYAFRPGSTLDGFSIGGGARYTGTSFGDDLNSFKNSDFLIFDAVAKVDLGRLNPRLTGVALQVNARNLLDKTIKTCELGYCYRDEGRQVIASLRYRW
jgi:iron complex outermembrane receptor protein